MKVTILEILDRRKIDPNYMEDLFLKDNTCTWLDLAQRVVLAFINNSELQVLDPFYAYSASNRLFIMFKGDCSMSLECTKFIVNGEVIRAFKGNVEPQFIVNVAPSVSACVDTLSSFSKVIFNLYDTLTMKDQWAGSEAGNSLTGGAVALNSENEEIVWNGDGYVQAVNWLWESIVC